ncbi:MAG: septation protein SpoVG family protein [Nitrospinaceae bacterium]
MEISEVKIFPFEPGDLQKNLKAYAEITLDDSLTIKGIKIFEKENGGIFITFPAIQSKDKTFHDIVIPANPKIKKQIRDAVVEVYKKTRE